MLRADTYCLVVIACLVVGLLVQWVGRRRLDAVSTRGVIEPSLCVIDELDDLAYGDIYSAIAGPVRNGGGTWPSSTNKISHMGLWVGCYCWSGRGAPASRERTPAASVWPSV